MYPNFIPLPDSDDEYKGMIDKLHLIFKLNKENKEKKMEIINKSNKQTFIKLKPN